MDQLPLGGFEPPARRRHRLFFALWPDATTRARIEAATVESMPLVRGSGRRLRPHRYHLTLRWLGDHPDAHTHVLDMATHAARRVRLAPFDLHLDLRGAFPSARVCWLGCRQAPAALPALRARLDEGLLGGPVRLKGATALVPHVTVLRDCVDPWPEGMLASPVAWRIERFVLLRSDLDAGHAYEEVAAWPLEG
ncbi:RNA 2',3'-cyclic phosphodiesterase [Marilutibacter spongiae]|uniref:RNA 2',3'-cyclic phosphodiesterase n=1 Tax=Marilutibacter spongiae TaxID=2025720 RepID=A0A7W3TJF5_9GAMM|nr:RNA 2',3'-cyclic phosphodiesterase [Lysobacter spongiae]MBB1059465.1 RNA 2',3'-cyclic phosphodiesterase [Lysobacter spongiae]